jgi:hypothetical protein
VIVIIETALIITRNSHLSFLLIKKIGIPKQFQTENPETPRQLTETGYVSTCRTLFILRTLLHTARAIYTPSRFAPCHFLAVAGRAGGRLARPRRASSLAWRGDVSRWNSERGNSKRARSSEAGEGEEEAKGEVGREGERPISKSNPALLSRPQNLMPGSPRVSTPTPPLDTAYGPPTTTTSSSHCFATVKRGSLIRSLDRH